jgi:hypothetical protein
MKYIIVPPIKFIGAIFYTVLMLIVEVSHITFYLLWNLKGLPCDFFKYKYDCLDVGSSITFYYKRNPNNWHPVYFKSIFHFIWNIQ